MGHQKGDQNKAGKAIVIILRKHQGVNNQTKKRDLQIKTPCPLTVYFYSFGWSVGLHSLNFEFWLAWLVWCGGWRWRWTETGNRAGAGAGVGTGKPWVSAESGAGTGEWEPGTGAVAQSGSSGGLVLGLAQSGPRPTWPRSAHKQLVR